MNKRDFLKTAPMAAMGAVAITAGGIEAQAYEVKAQKKYIIVLPDDAVISHKDLTGMADAFRGRGIDATVLMGAEGLQIYEVG